jgi:hypothetical protein
MFPVSATTEMASPVSTTEGGAGMIIAMMIRVVRAMGRAGIWAAVGVVLSL